MTKQRDLTLLNLATFRENLNKMMKPEILHLFAKFLESTANNNNSMLTRFKWFVENSTDGLDCKYAGMAKEFFLKNQAESVAKAIIDLYHKWAKFYE